jgi:hypothetical protein
VSSTLLNLVVLPALAERYIQLHPRAGAQPVAQPEGAA